MKPRIDGTKFGSITIAGEEYEHDVVLRLHGKVEKRKKKLSKEIFGTSHIISLPEAEFVYESGARWILVGTGQDGMVQLSEEARQFLKEKDCKAILLPTPEAIERWNELEGEGIALFHVTC